MASSDASSENLKAPAGGRSWSIAVAWGLAGIPATVLAAMFLTVHGGMLFVPYSPWAVLVALSGAGFIATATVAFAQGAIYGLVLQVGAWRQRTVLAALLLLALHAVGISIAWPRLYAHLF